MPIKSELTTLINENWANAKAEIKNTWKKLSDADLEKITNYKELVDKLKEVYQTTEAEILTKIEIIIDKLGLTLPTDSLWALKNALYESAIKASNSIGISRDILQEKSADLQEMITTYVKKNPYQSIGWGMLVAGMLSYFVCRKSE